MLELLGTLSVQLYQEFGWPFVAILVLMVAAFLGGLGRTMLEPPTRRGRRSSRW